ncbi:MAG: protease modulator HflC [Pseudomonadota bacterium]
MSRGRTVLRYLVGGVCVVALLGSAIGYSVPQGHQAVVVRFGEVVRVTEQAGLHLKAPWPIERIVEIDARRRWLSTPPTELLTRDRKNIVLVTGAAWQTRDAVQFYRALGSLEQADEKINSLMVNAKIAVFGRYDLSALVSTDSEALQVERIERDVLEAVNEVSSSKYGVEVVHAGFQRVSLPEQNIVFVLEQMRAERRQFAARFRAQGSLQAAQVRSRADLEAARILSQAEEQAAQILGEAEAEAARIYVDAHRTNPDFYHFMRSLDSLARTLGRDAGVTLRTDSAPFELLISLEAGSGTKVHERGALTSVPARSALEPAEGGE